MLSTKQGDSTARAELLGKLLLAVGQQPYLLRHGTGRNEHALILLALNDEEREGLAKALNAPVPPLQVSRLSVVAFPLEAEAEIGTVNSRLYDAERRRWTATIALHRLR